MLRTIEIPGDQIEVHADIGPGRILRATLTIEEVQSTEGGIAPTDVGIDRFETELDELLLLIPPSEFPVDDSREAIYGPDPERPS